MKCEYCLTDNQSGEYCEKCGAKLPIKKDDYKSEPFFYNGYICYAMRHYEKDSFEVQFWLGRELIQRIDIPREIVDEQVPLYCDKMPFFWDLFLVAQGEKEVLEWQEKNTKYPARFEVRRIENEEKQSLLSMDRYQLAEAFVK